MIAIVDRGRVRPLWLPELAALLRKPEREDEFPSAAMWARFNLKESLMATDKPKPTQKRCADEGGQ